jgi:UDP-N-acetylmuramate-alanine ligase
VTLVIDDFHHVPDDAKQALARAIKSVIPFCKVVLIAVPHEAFDATSPTWGSVSLAATDRVVVG